MHFNRAEKVISKGGVYALGRVMGGWGPQSGCSPSSPSGPRTSSRAPCPPPTTGVSSQTLGEAQYHLGVGAGGRKAACLFRPQNLPQIQRDAQEHQFWEAQVKPQGSGHMGEVAGGGSQQNDRPRIALETGAGEQNFSISSRALIRGHGTLNPPMHPGRLQVSSPHLHSPTSQGLHSPASLKVGTLVIMQHPGEPTWILLARCLECNTEEGGSLPRPAHSFEGCSGGLPLLLSPSSPPPLVFEFQGPVHFQIPT